MIVKLDASISKLNDPDDEIIYFTRDFGDGKTLNNISQIYHEKGDPHKALKYLKQSLEIRKQINDYQGEGVSLHNYAANSCSKGNLETAIFYSEKSIKLFQRVGYRQGETSALLLQATILNAKGDFKVALKKYEEVIILMKEIDDISNEAVAKHNMGHIYFEQKCYEKALTFLIDSYFIRQKINSPSLKHTENYIHLIIEKIGKEKFFEIVSKRNQP